jgi:predicted RNA-binding Zn ribbon-like protein
MTEITGVQAAGSEQTEFEFTGGRLCLDFVDTVNSRLDAPRDLLCSYDDLLAWGQQAGILSDEDASGLRSQSTQHPEKAAHTLQDAIAVRETIYRIFQAITQEDSPAASDLAAFNAALAQAMTHGCIVPQAGGFVWHWDDSSARQLDRVLWPVLRSVADLLTSPDLELVRLCAAEDCGWLFLDESKNHTRRWCDMKTCGNRAKARRHYQKKQEA